MSEKISIRDAYSKEVIKFSENKGPKKFVTYKTLLENTEEIKKIAENLFALEAMAKVAKPVLPQFNSYVAELFESIKTSQEKKTSIQLSLLRAAALLEHVSSLQESFKSPAAAFVLENDPKFVPVKKELQEANKRQIEVLSESLKGQSISFVVSESSVKKLMSESKNSIPSVETLIRINMKEHVIMEASDLRALSASLDALTNVVAKLGPEFRETKAGMDKFKTRFRNAASGGFAGLTVDRQKRLLAQVELVLQMFKKLGQIWPSLEKLFGDNFSSDPENIEEYTKIKKQFEATLKKQLSGGLLGGLSRLFGRDSVIFPSEINPDVVIKDMMEVLEAPAPGTPELGPQQPRPARTTGAIAESAQDNNKREIDLVMEDLAKLSSVMKTLASAAPQTPPPEETAKLAAEIEKGQAPESSGVVSQQTATGGEKTSSPSTGATSSIEAAIEKVKKSSIPTATKRKLITKAVDGIIIGNVADAIKNLEQELKNAESAGNPFAPAAKEKKKAPTTSQPAPSASPSSTAASTSPTTAKTTAPSSASSGPKKMGV